MMQVSVAAAILLTVVAGAAAATPGPVIGPAVPAATAPNNASYPLAVRYVCAKNFYVDAATGNDKNIGTSPASPWRSIGYAEDILSGAKPGTCINAAPGTYKENVTITMGGERNAIGGYGVLRCTTAAEPYLYAVTGGALGSEPACFIDGPGRVNSIVTFLANFAIIDGFDVTSSDRTGMEEGIGGDALNPSQCPDIGCHHLGVYNNRVHDVGGGGIEMARGSAWYVQGNEVFDTASRDSLQESGISLCCTAGSSFSGPLDNSFGRQNGVFIQNLVTNNVSHDNVITAAVTANHTDGEGIIIDTLGTLQAGCIVQNTVGTLVYGNVTYGNGGEGVSAFFSSFVAVYNNTSYHNFIDVSNNATARPEFNNGCAHDNTYANNAGVAVVGTSPPLTFNNAAVSSTEGLPGTEANVLWTNNVFNTVGTSANGVVLAGNGDQITAPPNNFPIDPQWTAPTATPPDFLPLTGSPLLGTNSPTTNVTALGGPAVSSPDIGAY